jgi:hypothetical protein
VPGSIGYREKIFRRMMAHSGPVAACNSLMMSDRIPDGFLILYHKKRLDLTVEAIILRPPWRNLFSIAVQEKARNRLRQYHRHDLAKA